MIKCRRFGEVLTAQAFIQFGIPNMPQKQHQRLRVLSDQGFLTKRVRGWFDEVRNIGNLAVHEGYAAQRDALQLVRACYELGAWFHRTVSGSRDGAPPFVPPQPGVLVEPASTADSHALQELRQLLQRYHAELVEMKTTVDEQTARAAAEAAAQAAANQEILRAVRAQAGMQQLIQQLSTTVDDLQRQLATKASAAAPIDSALRDEYVHHDAAEAWFIGSDDNFATCPITEGSLLRLLVREGQTVDCAQAILTAVRNSERHEFWPDSISYDDVPMNAVLGHRQVTDSYLAQLARTQRGRLATFDQGLTKLHTDIADLLPTIPTQPLP